MEPHLLLECSLILAPAQPRVPHLPNLCSGCMLSSRLCWGRRGSWLCGVREVYNWCSYCTTTLTPLRGSPAALSRGPPAPHTGPQAAVPTDQVGCQAHISFLVSQVSLVLFVLVVLYIFKFIYYHFSQVWARKWKCMHLANLLHLARIAVIFWLSKIK